VTFCVPVPVLDVCDALSHVRGFGVLYKKPALALIEASWPLHNARLLFALLLSALSSPCLSFLDLALSSGSIMHRYNKKSLKTGGEKRYPSYSRPIQ
jgi:hypothetical protein